MITWTQLCGAQEARLLATLKNSTASGRDEPIQNAIASAINTAIHSGLYTCTVSLSAYPDSDRQVWLNMLSGLSYGVSYANSTVTLTW